MKIYKEVLNDNKVVSNRENANVEVKDVITDIHNNTILQELPNIQTNQGTQYIMEIDNTSCKCRLGAIPNILISLGCNIISSDRTEQGTMLQKFKYDENIQNVKNYLTESGYIISML